MKAFVFNFLHEMLLWSFILLLISYINLHVSDISKAAKGGGPCGD